MRIGIPRERKQGECRVAVTPEGVEALTALGNRVYIETNAGLRSGFSDDEFNQAGASVLDSLEKIWQKAELLIKVKEPAPEEIPFFRDGLIVFSFLHHAAFPELTDKMLHAGVSGLDYDLVTLDDGRFPILEPMSIIAGKLSVQCGAFALQSGQGGRGVLLGGTEDVSPAKVVIIGAGAAGSSAAHVAYGMGARVCILDINKEKLTPYTKMGEHVKTRLSNTTSIEEEAPTADLLIGSVLVPGDKAPKLITHDILKTMKPGAVLVDICIDQGGCAETSIATTIAKPTYIKDKIVHYCVPNMPALVPRTSTEALTSKTLEWIKKIARGDFLEVLKASDPLKRSLTTYQGKLTNQTIGDALGIPAIDTDSLLV